MSAFDDFCNDIELHLESGKKELYKENERLQEEIEKLEEKLEKIKEIIQLHICEYSPIADKIDKIINE